MELSILIPTVLIALLDIAVLSFFIPMEDGRGKIRRKQLNALLSVTGTLVVVNVISGIYFGWL